MKLLHTDRAYILAGLPGVLIRAHLASYSHVNQIEAYFDQNMQLQRYGFLFSLMRGSK